MSNQSIRLLHYRNGVYQGQVKTNKRNGKGILITDSTEIIIGTWKNDKLHGQGLIFFSPFEYAYDQFNRGQLEGWFKFQSQDKILISEFNSDRPINKQLLIRKDQGIFKTIVPKAPIFEVMKQGTLQRNANILQLTFNELGVKLPLYSLQQYIQTQFKTDQFFQIETLPNGYTIFKFNDNSNPVSIGFVINKNEQLISYGSYINNKLNGYGCKYENTARYQGIFENGFLNGEGLKFNSGKYSYGTFENGTLIQPVYLQERSLASEEKLKELKKLHHIKNLNFSNVYIPSDILKFKGLKQITFQIALKQQFLFSQSADKTISPKKLNNLATKLLNRDDAETKSILSTSNRKRQKNPEQAQSRVSEVGKSFSGANSLRKFKI